MPLIILSFFVFVHFFLSAVEPALVLMGPPGVGKGTFSQYLKKNYGYKHISIGDLLRGEVEKKTPLGLQIEESIKKGEYIDPTLVWAILETTIRECQQEQVAFILDAFGQNDGEVEEIRRLFEKYELLDRAITVFLDADDTMCQSRVHGRLICLGCGQVYNTLTVPPLVEGVCDYCDHTLCKRLNDTPEVIVKRIKNYRENIQRKQEMALQLFPSLIMNTNQPIDRCITFYDWFAEVCKTSSSIDQLQSKE